MKRWVSPFSKFEEFQFLLVPVSVSAILCPMQGQPFQVLFERRLSVCHGKADVVFYYMFDASSQFVVVLCH